MATHITIAELLIISIISILSWVLIKTIYQQFKN